MTMLTMMMMLMMQCLMKMLTMMIDNDVVDDGDGYHYDGHDGGGR
jgi:hypothetical protein